MVVAILAVLQPSWSTSPVHSLDYSQLTPLQKRLLSGYASLELDPQSARHAQARPARFTPQANRAAAALAPGLAEDAPVRPEDLTTYFPRRTGDCPENLTSNLKVNRNCQNLTDPDLQGRGQAQNEPAIAQDPTQPDHLIASYNDYRRGDGNCYGSYSLDRGRTWRDFTAPMGFTRGQAFGAARQYWEAGGDTAVAWDTKGNAYLLCMMFNRGLAVTPNPDQSSAIYVFRSTQNFGASWNFPARPVYETANVSGTNTLPFQDKPYMTVDNHTGSPFQDRIYVTWTEFTADGTAYIYGASSADYGEHFSPRRLVSTNSPLCANTYGLPTPQGNCNANQFSQPFTGADGALYVVFNNYNNAISGADNRNQILLVRSTDGGASFSAPVKVADFYDLPDCATYQGGKNPGRACVPEKGSTTNSYFRAANYPSGAVDPTNPRQVVVAFGSYINVHSKEANGCVPQGIDPATGNNLFTGVKTLGACNNDILLSVSTDGGTTFTGTTTDPRELTSVNQDSGQATTDQWFQWLAFTKNGTVAVAYYDRQYGDDELTGFSDFSLSGSRNLRRFGTQRVTSNSLPPPTQFAGVFWGDYTGLTAGDTTAFPIWSDTRNPELFLCPDTGTPTVPPAVCTGSAENASLANDQDIFTQEVRVPLP